MARYIDADLLLERLNKKRSEVAKIRYTEGFNDAIMRVRSMISSASTADVVPKSEVVNILDGLMKEARETADRYEKSANETSDYDCARIEYRGCQMGALLVLFKIAELKKKYTEENK